MVRACKGEAEGHLGACWPDPCRKYALVLARNNHNSGAMFKASTYKMRTSGLELQSIKYGCPP